MLAGSLEVQMLANVARLARDMQDAKRIVGEGTSAIAKMAETAKNALGLIGVGLSAGAMLAFAKSTVDAIAKMKDFGEEAGTTAERISRFSTPAKMARMDLEDVATAIFRVSKAAVEARDPSSQAALALKSIGLSVKDLKGLKPDDMFELIARQMAKYGNGVEKNAAMQILFNRSGKDMQKVVSEIAAAGELHAKVTNEEAEQAKRLEDQLITLKANGDKFWRGIANDAIPALNSIVEAFRKAKDEGGLLNGVFAAIDATIDAIRGGKLKGELDKVNAELFSAQSAQKYHTGTMSFMFSDAQRAKDIENVNRLLAQQADIQHRLAKEEQDAQDKRAIAGQVAARDKPPPKLDLLAAQREAVFAAENASLDQQIAKLRGVGELEAYILKLGEDRFRLLAPMTAQQKEEIEGLRTSKDAIEYINKLKEQGLGKSKAALAAKEAELVALDQEKHVREAIAKSIEAYYQQLSRARDAEASFAVGQSQQIDDLKFEISLLGKAASEQEKLTALRKADSDLMATASQMSSADQDGLDDASMKILSDIAKRNEGHKQEIASLKDTKTAIEQQLTAWQDFAQMGASALEEVLNHTKTFAQAMVDMMKRMFLQIAAIFAQRLILQIGASLVGGTAGTALASQAGTVGQGTAAGAGASLIGTGLSAANQFGGSLIGASTFTGGISSALFGNAALTGAGDFVGTGLSGFVGEMAMAASATDTFALTLAQAVPVIGWIVAIGAVLYTMFGSKGGGPKGGGSFMGAFNQFGSMTGSASVPGTDNGRFFTPSQSDHDLLVMGRAVGTGFADTVRSLGGHAGNVQFGFGFDTDPSGTAQNRVSGMAVVNGQTVYNVRDREVGRDSDELQRQIKLETERAMLAALQASDLPAAVKAWLNTLDASTASETEIQNLLKGAAAIKGLIDETQSLDDAIAALADPTGVTAITNQLKGLDKAVSDALDALNVAQNKNDPEAFLQAEQAYRQAVMNRYQQEINMVRQLQASIRQVEEAAYQFAINIAQRINAVGGSIDIGALGMNRATDLRGTIGANSKTPVDVQLQNLQGYVGAIDTWYNARRDAIMQDAQAQAAAAQAVAQAQQSAAQARVQQLQGELQQVQAMKSIIDQAAKMAKDLELSSDNPLHALGRFQIAKEDVDKLRAEYLAATGDTDKATAAQKLMDALQSERGLMGAFQRPSNDFTAAYNQIQADLALIQKDAKTIDERQLELTQKIAEETQRAASYGAVTADATSIARSQLASLDAEARGYYTWAQAEGARLYTLQRTAYQQQLDAITGGSDPELFIAQRTHDMTLLLQSIDAKIAAFLAHVGDPADGSTTAGGGPTPKPSDGVTKSAPVTLHLTVAAGEDPVDAVIRAAPRIKRAIANA